MLQTELKQKFKTHLEAKYPTLATKDLENLISDQLLSPFTVRLPRALLNEMIASVEAFAELRENLSYQDYVLGGTPELLGHKASNHAMCNSLDFHVSETGELKLVEINTNAAFLALGLELYDFRNITQNYSSKGTLSNSAFVCKMVQNELSYFPKLANSKRIAIVDDNPENQRLYCEFLIFQEYFRAEGFECEILDRSQIESLAAEFIYNRCTDFFLSEELSKNLKQNYLSQKTCVSPSPWEYALLADKSRFIDWTDGHLLDSLPDLSMKSKEQILKVLPYSYTVTKKDKESVWAERKKLFFKPKRSFGSKQTLKGVSIARKAFDEVYNPNFLAQELITPAEMSFQHEEVVLKMKYDLRCYFYQNQLQSIIARIYQGQVTNLRTPNGGFACVEFF